MNPPAFPMCRRCKLWACEEYTPGNFSVQCKTCNQAQSRKRREGNAKRKIKSMNHKEQTAAFEAELRTVIDRFRSEFDLTYAAVIGTLTLAVHTLAVEANQQNQ